MSRRNRDTDPMLCMLLASAERPLRANAKRETENDTQLSVEQNAYQLYPPRFSDHWGPTTRILFVYSAQGAGFALVHHEHSGRGLLTAISMVPGCAIFSDLGLREAAQVHQIARI